ncbi:MAG: hypothetical protein WC387_01215 [Candidatus Paceibacterota bacterium]
MKTLAHTDKVTFTREFEDWRVRWRQFLNEKSIEPKTGKPHFVHRRLISARNSLRHHSPYLFIFEDYPELHIPNTTNSLNGSFKKVKMAIGIHAGLSDARKSKLVKSLVMKSITFDH